VGGGKEVHVCRALEELIHHYDHSGLLTIFFKEKTACEIGHDWSSDVCSSDLAPTVMTYGSLPGELMVPYPWVPWELSRPSLPAATTTVMPDFQANSTAWQSGSTV